MTRFGMRVLSSFKMILVVTAIGVASLGLTSCQSVKNAQTQTNVPVEPPIENPLPESVVETATIQPELPITHKDIWSRIRAGYGLPEADNARIEKELTWYLNYKSYYEMESAESRPYIHYVVTELERNQIPLEIALLPFVESAYNPHARSPGRQSNVGMWQIAPITGKYFGLQKNNWYDGRKDVVASTEVAVSLLKKMYTMFDNDWLLAIAAYNAGERIVYTAIQKNKRAGKPTDFWSLPLPKTTLAYVSKIYAFSRIVKDPNHFQFELAKISNEPYFLSVIVGPQVNLADLCASTEVDAKHIKKLNAGFSSWITDPTSQRTLLVPVEHGEKIKAALDALPPMPLMKWIEHKVKSGDTLYDLARHYGVSIQAITNSNGIKNNILHLGQTLQIPISTN